jgi:hypothetical protein
MGQPRIYADFQNADSRGRIRLNCVGTTRDLARQQARLRDGPLLELYADDADDAGRPEQLQASGVVEYSQDEQCWVVVIDWDAIRRVPEGVAGEVNRTLGTDVPISVEKR